MSKNRKSMSGAQAERAVIQRIRDRQQADQDRLDKAAAEKAKANGYEIQT